MSILNAALLSMILTAAHMAPRMYGPRYLSHDVEVRPTLFWGIEVYGTKAMLKMWDQNIAKS